MMMICPSTIPAIYGSVLLLATTGMQAENIALDRPCKIQPASASLDRRSPRLLTDGKQSGDPIWEQSETLKLRSSEPISITFDLKEIAPISGLSVSSAAGVATSGKDIIVWPGRIDIFTSDDNQSYFYAGELTSLNDSENEPLPPFGEYARRKIQTKELKTSGRYLKLVISYAREVYIDEVEIYKGDSSFLKLPRPPQKYSDDSEISKLVKLKAIDPSPKHVDPQGEAAMVGKMAEMNVFAIKRRYRQDIAVLLQKIGMLPPAEVANFRPRLLELKARIENEEVHSQPLNTLPAGPLGEAILQQQAAIWKASGTAPLTVWQSGLWDYLAWMQDPPKTSAPTLHAALMKGEYRSVSFNLTNASLEPKRLIVNLRGLPEGDNPDYIAFHPVAWTETAWRLPVASALPEIQKGKEGYEVVIPAGLTQQIWLTFKGPKESGDFQGSIEISETGMPLRSIPLGLKVYPLEFPAARSLHLGGFECASNATLRRRYGVFNETLVPFTKLLRKNFVDAPWATRTEFAFGTFNAKHEYATPEDQPEAAQFDNWVQNLWPGADRYMVALTVKTKDRTAVIQGCDFAKDPEGFEKRVANWLGYWRDHLKNLNVKPEQIYFKLIDEPGYNEAAPYIDDEVIRIWSDAIRKSNTGFRVFINPIYVSPWDASLPMLDNADVLCVKYSHLLKYGERYTNFYKERGKELSVYECYGAPGHLYDPYSYYRLQAWQAWEIGATSIFYWNFADTGAGEGFMDSWNTGLNQWYYTPLFLTPQSVTTSKQMEAIREGVEDYQYLHMLRAAIATAKLAGRSPALIAEAEALLRDAPGVVIKTDALAEPRWAWPKKIDRNPADAMRLKILDTLVALEGAANPHPSPQP